MFARVLTFVIDGAEARPVHVELHLRSSLPGFTLVGSSGAAVRDGRERVRSTILTSGPEFPQRAITANLAPAALPKLTAGLDLPLACAVLVASGQLDPGPLRGAAFAGELALDCRVRPVNGTLAIAEAAHAAGCERLFVAPHRAAEAALIDGLRIVPVRTLAEVGAVRARRRPTRRRSSPTSAATPRPSTRWSLRPPAATTSCPAARPAWARPCWRRACRACCRRRPRGGGDRGHPHPQHRRAPRRRPGDGPAVPRPLKPFLKGRRFKAEREHALTHVTAPRLRRALEGVGWAPASRSPLRP